MIVKEVSKANNGNVEIVIGSEKYGTSIISVLVKRSYKIMENQQVARCDSDAPFRNIDVYFDDGNPTETTVQYESELAPLKALTDVVIIGNAHAPNGNACQQMSVSASVGQHTKHLQITGDRKCIFQQNREPIFSDPVPFTIMPLRYERAYGGKDELSNPQIPFRYPRNDLGVGLALENKLDVIEGLRLPNIESPSDLLTPSRVVLGTPKRWHEQPLPQGLSCRHRTWFPRCALIGSYPAFLDAGTVTMEEKMGLLPTNYVALAKQSRLAPNLPLFANGASFDMSFENLPNDAPIKLKGLSRADTLEFRLPGDIPQIVLDVGYKIESLDSRLMTVVIQPDSKSLEMIWSGKFSVGDYSRWALISKTRVEVR